MELDWALLCNTAEIGPGGLLNLTGVQWDTAWSIGYPAGVGGTVVLRFTFDPPDVGNFFPIELRFTRHGGAAIGPPMIHQLPTPPLPAGWEEGVSALATNVILAFQGLPVQEPGRYELQVVHQGQVLKAVPFWARQGAPPGVVIP